MQHDDQHRDAISRTVRVVDEVTATIFDDKVKEMGRVRVTKGKITIELDHTPSMITDDARRDILFDSIRLGLEACWKARSSAFDPFST